MKLHPQKAVQRIPNEHKILFALLSTVAAIYAVTLEQSPGAVDSAKFAFLGHIGGTPHATGYPGYLMALGAFSHLVPFGSLAVRANAFSALCFLATVALSYRLLTRRGVEPVVAAITMGTLALTIPVWSQSVVAEVYTFALLFIAAMAHFAMAVIERSRPIDVVLLSLVYSLSFGTHMVSVMFAPAVASVLIAWAYQNRGRRSLVLGTASACLATVPLAAMQYLYSFAVTSADRPYLEIRVRDLSDLWYMASGAQLSGHLFGLPINELISDRIPALLKTLLLSWFWLLPIAVIGVNSLRSRFGLFFELAFWANFLFIATYSIFDIESYFLPMHWFIAIFVAFGIQHLLNQPTMSPSRTFDLKALRAALRSAGDGASPSDAPTIGLLKPTVPSRVHPSILIGLGVIPLLAGALAFPKVDVAQQSAKREHIPLALSLLKKPAIVVAGGTNIEDYTRFELWAYELIGNGEGAKRNIWLSALPTAKTVAAYIRDNKPLPAELGSYRDHDLTGASTSTRDVPTGLQIYVAQIDLIPKLRALGLNCERVDERVNLWEVSDGT